MISDTWKLRLTRGMQVSLAAMVVSGLFFGMSVLLMNGAVGLAISFLPALLERDHSVALNPGIVVWITSAVFLHSIGSAGFYGYVWWWDHLTHSLSASLVAGVGYTAVRSIDIHSDEVHLPGRFMFVFILMTVLAFGVVWELLEFGLDVVANFTGFSMPLVQHGLEDTMKDMTFNTFGALVVAVLGQAHLNDLADQFMDQLQEVRE